MRSDAKFFCQKCSKKNIRCVTEIGGVCLKRFSGRGLEEDDFCFVLIRSHEGAKLDCYRSSWAVAPHVG